MPALKHGRMTACDKATERLFIDPCPHCGATHWIPDRPVGTCPATGHQFKVIDSRYKIAAPNAPVRRQYASAPGHLTAEDEATP